MRQPVFEPGQPEPLQRGRRTIPGFVLSAAKIQRPKGHVFQHRGTEKLILGVLEDQAHLAAQFPKVLFRFQRTPVKEDTAFLRCRQPHDQPEKRRLAASVRTVQADLPVRVQGKIHIPEDLPSSGICERNMLQRENGLSHGETPDTDQKATRQTMHANAATANTASRDVARKAVTD